MKMENLLSKACEAKGAYSICIKIGKTQVRFYYKEKSLSIVREQTG